MLSQPVNNNGAPDPSTALHGSLTNVDPAVVYTIDQNGNYGLGSFSPGPGTPGTLPCRTPPVPESQQQQQQPVLYMTLPVQVISSPSPGTESPISASYLPMTPMSMPTPTYFQFPNPLVSTPGLDPARYAMQGTATIQTTPLLPPDSGIVPDEGSLVQSPGGECNYFQYPPTSPPQA